MKQKTALHILAELTESLTLAAAACDQIKYYGNAPGMMILRDALNLTKEGCLILAKQNAVII